MSSKKAVRSAQITRQQAVATALGSVRLEGLEPSDATKKRLARYANGEISTDQLQNETLAEVKTASAHKTK